MKQSIDIVKLMDHDGLNNVTYKVRNVALEPLYTIITVDLPGPTTKTEIAPFFKATHEKLKRLYKSRRQKGLERGKLLAGKLRNI